MKRRGALFCFALLAACLLLGIPFEASYGGKAISSGMSLPGFTLAVPGSAPAREYLGLKNTGSFSIPQIPAKLVLIQFFSLYCPHCHRQAPKTNKVFKIISQDEQLNKDIKMIGIGVGNNSREIDAYRTQFHVLFPLFPDPKFETHKKLGEPRTPFIMLVSNKGKVLLTLQGIMRDIDEFLLQIRKFHKQK